VEDAIAALKKVMDGEDASEIKRLSEALTQASHKLAEAMYQRASEQSAQNAGESGQAEHGQAGSAAADDDVVDADFEEVKEDKK
jgi:molecular chaperone DnaK